MPAQLGFVLDDVSSARAPCTSDSSGTTGASRRVVDLGRRSRFFTGALRRAIQLRDRHCTHPGCDTPADDCDVDHRVPYAKGGRTDQSNGGLKCPHHNRYKGAQRAG